MPVSCARKRSPLAVHSSCKTKETLPSIAFETQHYSLKQEQQARVERNSAERASQGSPPRHLRLLDLTPARACCRAVLLPDVQRVHVILDAFCSVVGEREAGGCRGSDFRGLGCLFGRARGCRMGHGGSWRCEGGIQGIVCSGPPLRQERFAAASGVSPPIVQSMV